MFVLQMLPANSESCSAATSLAILQRPAVHRLQITLATDQRQLLAVGVVRERLDDVGAGVDELPVQLGDELRLLEHDLGHERARLQIATTLELEQVPLGADHRPRCESIEKFAHLLLPLRGDRDRYSRNDRTVNSRRDEGDCMKSSAQVVVIGGGVVGASVLFHLTEAGWTDVVLVERKELTAGSTWHSAGGMHTLNGDPNVSKLQQYTIELYRKIEARSGQNCSIHLPGGLMLANDRERLDWLRMAQARGRYLGMELEIISAAEAKTMFPMMEEQYFVGALFDPVEGHVDPSGVTNAYAICARQAGAEIYRHTWVSDLRQRA